MTGLWQAFLSSIRKKVSAQVFENWFCHLRVRERHEGCVYVEVHDQFTHDFICDHYLTFLEEELSQLAGEPLRIELEIVTAPRAEKATAPFELELSTPHGPEHEIPANSVGAKTDGSSSGKEPQLLNVRYNFGNFVEGPSNQLAVAACQRVAERPATTYNPLFLMAGVGLGKTHLLNAIGNHVTNQFGFRVHYTSGEEFMNELITSIRFERMEAFREKYRNNCDMLLIDDIHFIAGKERTQEEFFHTFNALHASNRQIIVSSDKLPHEIPGLEERLRSRFQSGLIADIQAPELETRIAILRRKMESEDAEMDQEALLFLAQNFRNNVRELEGALMRVLLAASMTNGRLDLEFVKQVLKEVIPGRARKLSIETIQRQVAGYYNVPLVELTGPRRHRSIARPRQVAMYLCRKHLETSFPEIGREFGRDHSTVISAVRVVEKELANNDKLGQEIETIERAMT